jgi:hypothetical protein
VHRFYAVAADYSGARAVAATTATLADLRIAD